MNDTAEETAHTLTAWAQAHSDVLVLAGLGLTALLLAFTVRKAIRSGRPDVWLARLSLLVGFGWSGEAMWEVATQKLDLSPAFAGFAFFLFESQMATAMLRAERHQDQHQRPGKHGRAVWLTAIVAGAIAAMAGDSPVEVGLRLAVPLMVAHQWWVGLTSDATDRPADAITWTLTPRRILIAVGLAKPGEHDLNTVNRQRHIHAIVTVSHRLHTTSWAWRRTWLHRRLRRLAITADDEMLDAARAQVQRIWQAADRTRPATAGISAASAQAQADPVPAKSARVPAAGPVTTTGHLRAEPACRAEPEAEGPSAEPRAEGRGKEAEAQAEAEAPAEGVPGHARRRARHPTPLTRGPEHRPADKHEEGRTKPRPPQRARQTAASTGQPLMFNNVPVPTVPGASSSTVLAVLTARDKYPGDTQKQIAARVQTSDRTVRTVLAARPHNLVPGP